MKVIGVTGGVVPEKVRSWDILQNIGMQLLWKQMKWGIWSCGREKACYSAIVDLFGTENRERRSDAGPGTDCKNCI